VFWTVLTAGLWWVSTWFGVAFKMVLGDMSHLNFQPDVRRLEQHQETNQLLPD